VYHRLKTNVKTTSHAHQGFLKVEKSHADKPIPLTPFPMGKGVKMQKLGMLQAKNACASPIFANSLFYRTPRWKNTIL
jgi:hypothetical protein